MAGEGKGWISLHRSIQDNWLWQEKPFDKARAWLDLLLSANYQDKKFLLGNELVTVQRGSFITSQRKLMEKWGWGASKTRDFLKLLDADGMIKFQSDKKKTIIKIINYEEYQNQNTSNVDVPRDSEEGQNTNRTQTEREQNTNRTQTEPNNKENKENNVNKENKGVCIGEFNNVFLSEEEYENLISTHTKTLTDKYIQKLSLHMESNGKKYKSHYATIQKWILEDKDKLGEEDKPKDEYALGGNDLRIKLGLPPL